MQSYAYLCSASFRELDKVMQAGIAPELSSLEGWEFRGWNPWRAVALVGIRKFKKGFHAHPRDPARLCGYNGTVVQNGRNEPWIDKLDHGKPVRHSLYDVYPVRSDARDNLFPQALLLDYGCGRNPRLDPSSTLRDYLVQVERDNPDLLLGKAYGALGPLRLPLGYFVLERHNPA